RRDGAPRAPRGARRGWRRSEPSPGRAPAPRPRGPPRVGRAYPKLREKGGQHRRVPVHSRAAEALDASLAAAGEQPPDAPLFQAIAGRTGVPLSARSALRVVKRRAEASGIGGDLGCHSCRATGIMAYLVNGGTLECAAAIAGHASTRTT